MSEKASGPKTVAPRNNLKKNIPIVKQRPDLEGLDPAYRYERFSLDPRHPSFVGRKLNERAIGDDSIGWKVIPDGEGWEVVHRESDPRVAQLGIRDDQGKAVDTTIRHGNTVLCRMPKETWAQTYEWADKARVDEDAKRMATGETEHFGNHQLKARVSSDESAEIGEILSGVK